VRYTCSAPAGVTSCPVVQGFMSATADTANVIITNNVANGWQSLAANNDRNGSGPIGWTDSSTATASDTSRTVFTAKAVQFPTAGTYTYTFYTQAGNLGTSSATTTGVTWTVTITAPDTRGASLSRFYLSSDQWTANSNRRNLAPSSDSAITVSAGTAGSPAIVGYAFITTANAAGDTRVAVGSAFATVDESVTVTVSGPGTINVLDASAASSATSKSAVMNSRGGSTLSATETLTIYSDGTAGVSTLTFKNAAGVTLKTATITFVGPAASAGVALSDTNTFYSVGTVNLIAQVKDSGGNLLNSGTLYVFASDTAVVSAGASLYANASTQYQTVGRCGNTATQWNTSSKRLTCALTISDSGTSSIYLADSWNVTASSFVTTAITLQ